MRLTLFMMAEDIRVRYPVNEQHHRGISTKSKGVLNGAAVGPLGRSNRETLPVSVRACMQQKLGISCVQGEANGRTI